MTTEDDDDIKALLHDKLEIGEARARIQRLLARTTPHPFVVEYDKLMNPKITQSAGKTGVVGVNPAFNRVARTSIDPSFNRELQLQRGKITEAWGDSDEPKIAAWRAPESAPQAPKYATEQYVRWNMFDKNGYCSAVSRLESHLVRRNNFIQDLTEELKKKDLSKFDTVWITKIASRFNPAGGASAEAMLTQNVDKEWSEIKKMTEEIRDVLVGTSFFEEYCQTIAMYRTPDDHKFIKAALTKILERESLPESHYLYSNPALFAKPYEINKIAALKKLVAWTISLLDEAQGCDQHQKFVHQQLAEATQEKAKLSAEIADKTGQLADLQAKLDRQAEKCQADYSQHAQEKAQLSAEIADKTRQLADLQEELDKQAEKCQADYNIASQQFANSMQEKAKLTADIADKTRQMEKCDADFKNAAQELAESTQENKSLRDGMRALQDDLAVLQKREARIRELEEQLDAAATAAEQFRFQLAQIKADLQASEEQREQLSAAKDECESRLAQNKGDLDANRESCAQLNERLSEAEDELATLRAQLASSAEKSGLQESVDEKEAEAESLREQIEQVELQRKALEDELLTTQGLQSANTAELLAAKNRTDELQADLDRTRKELDDAQQSRDAFKRDVDTMLSLATELRTNSDDEVLRSDLENLLIKYPALEPSIMTLQTCPGSDELQLEEERLRSELRAANDQIESLQIIKDQTEIAKAREDEANAKIQLLQAKLAEIEQAKITQPTPIKISEHAQSVLLEHVASSDDILLPYAQLVQKLSHCSIRLWYALGILYKDINVFPLLESAMQAEREMNRSPAPLAPVPADPPATTSFGAAVAGLLKGGHVDPLPAKTTRDLILQEKSITSTVLDPSTDPVKAAQKYMDTQFNIYRATRPSVQSTRAWMVQTQQDPTLYTRLSPKEQEAVWTFNRNMGRLQQSSQQVFSQLAARAQTGGDRAKIEALQKKTADMYAGQLSAVDLILTPQIIALYGVKVLRVALSYLALLAAVRIFERDYMRAVYANNDAPPNLMIFLGIFLGLDAAFNVIAMGALSLLPDIVSPRLIFVDYGLHLVCLGVLGLVIAAVMQSKKYFKYRVQGMQTIRAYQEMLIGAAAVLAVVPFGMFS